MPDSSWLSSTGRGRNVPIFTQRSGRFYLHHEFTLELEGHGEAILAVFDLWILWLCDHAFPQSILLVNETNLHAKMGLHERL